MVLLHESIPAEWSSVDIEWGCPRTELLIEKETLKLPPRFTDTNNRSSMSTANAERNVLYIQDLVDRQIWAKHTGLDKAAKELAMSSTTLKRRLADMNTSYSEILAERRLHHGISLLENSDLSVKRIAEDLGYSAVSNYSRAFSKALGTSPSKWRKDRFGSQ